ncbi:porin [Shewanella sp. SR44-3]|uniref:porin n=1 Tax=unclassified Shewanella TaxID=196818 RepID=UPI0015FDC2E4|nr:porin [Shewanella sp. SR44-3]MBB1268224.1 porin [Shewanella sp. SR44-3]
MNNTLVSVAIASALSLSSFAAFAQGPDFYGRLDISLTHTDMGSTIQSGTNNLKKDESGTYFENNFSLVGVKGAEKISDNLEILYQMEFQVENTSGSGDTFKARNTYLGLKNQAGTLLFGRNDTVFKQSEGGIDLFGNTNADIDRVTGGQIREADGIWYYSPLLADMVGFNATYLMEDNQDTDDSQYALSVTLGDKSLKSHNFYVAGAYNKAIGNIDAYRAVAQVKLAKFKLGGLFQNSESNLDSAFDGNSYFVNLSYDLNGVNLKAEYGMDESGLGKYFQNISSIKPKAGTATNLSDINVQSITVGADYRLAKSTLVFAHYAMYQGDYTVTNKVDLEDDNVLSVGIRYDF